MWFPCCAALVSFVHKTPLSKQNLELFLIEAEGQVRDRLRLLQLLELLTPEQLLTNRLEALKRAVGRVSHEI